MLFLNYKNWTLTRSQRVRALLVVAPIHGSPEALVAAPATRHPSRAGTGGHVGHLRGWGEELRFFQT